jgi:hypothetical protein
MITDLWQDLRYGARVLLLLLLFAPACLAQVTLVTDEAEAVLTILTKQAAAQPIAEADWQRLFASEGYVRLKQREDAMKRSFTDEEFRAFVLSERLAAQRQALADTLAQWRRAEMGRAMRLALAYLPRGARIRAKIYPVIKPRDNSFVFDVKTDPAIFLYLDPTVSPAKFENTLAHELHHIGFSSSCPTAAAERASAALPPYPQEVMKWIGAFGEGFAMLAAAGGPRVHPHAVSNAEERARWDRDVANFNADLKKVERFFHDTLDERLTDEEIRQTASSFYGVQGPWYTVGWQMAVVIERAYGRAKLIECLCDQRQLLPTYNQAATKLQRQFRPPLAVWSEGLFDALKGQLPSSR